MDAIIIKELRVETIIGVLPEEKLKPQVLVIDLEIQTDLKKSGNTDNLANTIDYAKIAKYISNFAKQHQFTLLEAFAENLSAQLTHEFRLKTIQLTIQKPNAIPNARYAAVSIIRTN